MRIVANLLAVLLVATKVSAQEAVPTSGPFAITMEMDATLPGHTVYRPSALPDVKAAQLPVIAFGNGGCLNDGSLYQNLLGELASYGYLVVATGPIVPLSQPVDNDTRPAQLTEAIDWAEKENARADSPYLGKLDLKAVAVMGHSCGGRQALSVSDDPRVKTTVVLNSGVSSASFSRGDTPDDVLSKLHAPVLYMSGGKGDRAYAAIESDFKNITSVPIFKAERDAGHNATYFQPRGGSFAAVVRMWMQWHLKADATAAAQFKGASCGLCTDASWRVERKKLD